jgi:hypothetical protein
MKTFFIRMAGMLGICAATLNSNAQEKLWLSGPASVAHWKLRPQEIAGDSGWVDAVVPGCVFASYVTAGLEKDPNFGDNIYKVDQNKYNQAVRVLDGERILPALMNDNYFTLFKGETKVVTIEFDPALLQGGGYKLIVEPYNK